VRLESRLGRKNKHENKNFINDQCNCEMYESEEIHFLKKGFHFTMTALCVLFDKMSGGTQNRGNGESSQLFCLGNGVFACNTNKSL
jgi:hypothetical protein